MPRNFKTRFIHLLSQPQRIAIVSSILWFYKSNQHPSSSFSKLKSAETSTTSVESSLTRNSASRRSSTSNANRSTSNRSGTWQKKSRIDFAFNNKHNKLNFEFCSLVSRGFELFLLHHLCCTSRQPFRQAKQRQFYLLRLLQKDSINSEISWRD